MNENAVDWASVKGVVFDLDGTLYDQRRLRLRMLGEMLANLATGSEGLKTARVLYHFRRAREALAHRQLPDSHRLQYSLVAEKLQLPREKVVSIVDEWIHKRPLVHLDRYRRAGVSELFEHLRKRSIKIGVLSDYDANPKLAILGLHADVVYHSLQDPAGYLKPHPFGLRAILKRLGVKEGECVMVGDREDHDGACSAALDVPFLHCNRSTFFVELLDCLRGRRGV